MKRLQAKLQQLNARLRFFKKIKMAKAKIVTVILEILKIEKIIEVAQQATKTLELQTPRRAWRAWIATITNKKDPVHGGFQKSFIEPVSREFNRKGEISAKFEIPIRLNVIHQDSDGDFWIFKNLEGEIQVISYQEVLYRFSQM